MKPRQPRLPDLILSELDGLDWALERGRKHWQLRIGGDLVAILPNDLGEAHGPMRNNLAVRSAIRRWKHTTHRNRNVTVTHTRIA